MVGKQLIRVVLFAAALTVCAGQAQATLYNLTLTGAAADTVTNGYSNATDTGWTISLSGLNTPLTVYQGDEINATITLDKSVTIPASVSDTWLFLQLYGNNPAGINTDTISNTIISNQGVLGPTQTGSEMLTSNQLSAGAVLFPPDNTTFTFDTINIDFTINGLSNSGGPFDISFAGLTADGQNPATPVPEPATLILIATGLVGLVATRRKF